MNTNGQIFTKLGMGTMPLVSVPSYYVLIFCYQKYKQSGRGNLSSGSDISATLDVESC